ncbi:AAA family ATPase [Bradyrhizobium sp. WD16]|uniref:AAA family ATPase n=1 Tax=Bradyrhizobium sp. WD16 TaxID=1521768 RepID=UPI0020A2D894|nr:AAA family ATPase [Bradyrhizobium sp. WD16]UTD28911.1 ATPase [Bradyrhizobium sp. WD16]
MNKPWIDPRRSPEVRAGFIKIAVGQMTAGWSNAQIKGSMAAVYSNNPKDSRIQAVIDEARQQCGIPDPEGTPQAPEIDFIDIARWDAEAPPKRLWAVPDRIPSLQPSLLSGAGGIGKTILLLQLSFAVAAGLDWIGTLPEAGPIIYLGAEDDADELHRRLAAIRDHYAAYSDVQFATLAKRLHLTSYAGEDAALGRPNRGGVIEPTPLFNRLFEQACDIRPRVIGLDTISDIYGGNEHDRMQVAAFIGLLRKMALQSGAAIIVNAHPSLTGISSGSGLAGSTGWHDKVRSRMYFKPIATEGDEEPAPELRELLFLKNNYGPLGERIVLRWRNGVFVPEVGPAAFSRQAFEQMAEVEFLNLLDRYALQGRDVSDKKSPAYAPAQFAKEPAAKAKRLNSKMLADAMLRLFEANRIRVEIAGPPSRQTRRIVRV